MTKKFREVVIFILLKKEQVLVEKRLKDELEILSGQLLFPGGGVDNLENLEEALIRELKEELGIKPLNIIPIHTVENIYGLKKDVVLKPFIIEEWEGEIPSQVIDQKDPLIWVNLEIMLNSEIASTKHMAKLVKKHLEKKYDPR